MAFHRTTCSALLFLLAASPLAWAETCQENLADQQVRLSTGALNLFSYTQFNLESRTPRGVDCEIGVLLAGPGGQAPSLDYSEKLIAEFPKYLMPREIAREIGIDTLTPFVSLTPYRQVFYKTVSSAARSPELDVLLYAPGGRAPVVQMLWREFQYGQTEGQVTVLGELPFNTQSFTRCAGSEKPVCLRTYWKSNGVTAQVEIELNSSGQTLKVTRNLTSHYARTPHVHVGYVQGVPRNGSGGEMRLRHRVCHLIDSNGQKRPMRDVGGKNSCDHRFALEAQSLPATVSRHGGIVTYSVQVSNGEAYPLLQGALKVELPYLPAGAKLIDAHGEGWTCNPTDFKWCERSSGTVGNPEPTVHFVVQLASNLIGTTLSPQFHLYGDADWVASGVAHTTVQ